MSVTTQALVAYSDGTPLSGIKSIRRARAGAASGVGVVDTLFVLDTDGLVHYGASLNTLLPAYFSGYLAQAWGTVITAMEVFSAQSNLALDTIPVLILCGYYSALPPLGSRSFIAAVPIVSGQLGSELVQPTENNFGLSSWPESRFMEAFGYYGPQSSDYFAMGITSGWCRGPFAQLGNPAATFGFSSGSSALGVATPREPWLIEEPPLHLSASGGSAGFFTSMFGMSPDNTKSATMAIARPFLVMRGLLTNSPRTPLNYSESSGSRMVAYSLDEFGDALTGTSMFLSEYLGENSVWGGDVVLHPLSGDIMLPLPEGIKAHLSAGHRDGLALGWSLDSNTTPGTPVVGTLYGGLSALTWSYGYLFGFGTDIPNLQYVNPYTQYHRIYKVVCSHQGRLDDPTMDKGLAAVPLYNQGFVVLGHGILHYAMTLGDLSAGMSTPSFQFPYFPDYTPQAGISDSLIFRAQENNVSGLPNGWMASFTYVDTNTSELMLVIAHSTNGSSWSVWESQSLTALVAAEYPGAVSVNPRVVYSDGLGVATVSTLGMFLCVAGFVVEDSSNVFHYDVQLTARSSADVTNTIQYSVVTSAAAEDFNLYSLSNSAYSESCPDVFLLSVDKDRIRRYDHTTDATTDYGGKSVPLNSTDAPLITMSALWQSGEPVAYMPSGLRANHVVPVSVAGITDGGWIPYGFTGVSSGSLAFQYPKVTDTEVAILPLYEKVLMGVTAPPLYTSYEAANYSVAYSAANPEIGTLIFLKDSFGAVSHLMASHPGTALAVSAFDPLVKAVSPRNHSTFSALGFTVTDVYEGHSGVAPDSTTTVYVCDSVGNIRTLSIVAGAPTYSEGSTITGLFNFSDDSSLPTVPDQSSVGSSATVSSSGTVTVVGDRLILGTPLGTETSDYLGITPNSYVFADAYALSVGRRIEFSFTVDEVSASGFGCLMEMATALFHVMRMTYSTTSNALTLAWFGPVDTDTIQVPLDLSVLGVEHHVRIDFSGATIRLGLDGVQVGSFAGGSDQWLIDATNSDELTGLYFGRGVLAGNTFQHRGSLSSIRIAVNCTSWDGSPYAVPTAEYSVLGYSTPTIESASFPVLSTYFAGKGLLHIAKSGDYWLATYRAPISGATAVEMSSDFVTWQLIYDGVGSLQELASNVVDILPTAPVTRQMLIPDTTTDPLCLFGNLL